MLGEIGDQGEDLRLYCNRRAVSADFTPAKVQLDSSDFDDLRFCSTHLLRKPRFQGVSNDFWMEMEEFWMTSGQRLEA